MTDLQVILFIQIMISKLLLTKDSVPQNLTSLQTEHQKNEGEE